MKTDSKKIRPCLKPACLTGHQENYDAWKKGMKQFVEDNEDVLKSIDNRKKKKVNKKL